MRNVLSPSDHTCVYSHDDNHPHPELFLEWGGSENLRLCILYNIIGVKEDRSENY